MRLTHEMPAQLSLADQERDWRKAGRMAELGLSIVSGKGPRRMRDPASKHRDPGSDVKPMVLEHKKKSCASLHIKSTQIIINKRNTADSNALKVDERLQLARERREAYQKHLALRERSWLAREERAKTFHQKQLEERRRKLEEQRQKEERRRKAVEEKRKQRLKEERERYESVVRRTIERSQKAKQKLGHGTRRTNSTQSNKNAKRRSLSQWEIELVSRLQTPTISYLARSRSAVCLSRDTVVHVCRRSASCHANSSNAQKAQVHCGNAENRPNRSVSSVSIRRTANRELVAKGGFEKEDQQTQPHSMPEIYPKRDSNPQENTKLPKPGFQIRPNLRSKQEGLPPLLEEEDLEQEYELHPHLQRPLDATPQRLQNNDRQEELQINPVLNPPHGSLSPNGPSDGTQFRSPAWTTNREEATRLLAEKRRQARLQREKEEEEHRQKVETERKVREELARQRAEERARQEAEAVRQEEIQKKREEEKRLQAEQENARRQLEKEQRLQQQREEEALQRAQAEQQRLERETRFQREEAERQERKKRLDEIMKRTRKTESEDKNAVSVKGTLSGDSVKPVIRIPGPGKTSKLEIREEDDMLPTVVFKERRSFRPLSGLEEMQAHQQTEVI